MVRALLLLLIFLAGCTTAQKSHISNSSPQVRVEEELPEFYVRGVEIEGEKLEEMKNQIMRALVPLPGVTYEAINVTATELGTGLNLEVVASSRVSEGLDIYRFYYDPGSRKITLKGYVLEAIPPTVRSKAVSIALYSEEMQRILSENAIAVEPRVRRILPETAAKYYAPKTLFSVTWSDFEKRVVVSALVDLDNGRVVQTWTGRG